MRHEDGREVDLPPITPSEDGGGDRELFPPEPPFHYDAPTTGVINGTHVTGVDAATQLRAHVGYQSQPEDRADVAALAIRIHCVSETMWTDEAALAESRSIDAAIRLDTVNATDIVVRDSRSAPSCSARHDQRPEQDLAAADRLVRWDLRPVRDAR